MAENQRPANTVRGVVVSCIIAAAVIAILVFAISLTKPPTSHATPFDSHGFDYFALQEAASAKNAEHSELIRQEASESAQKTGSIDWKTEQRSTPAARDRVSTDLFVFDLPSYWSNRVNIVYGDDGSASVYANGFPEASLVTMKIVDASSPAIESSAEASSTTPAAEDNPDTALVFSKELGNGKRAELWMTNFAWIVFDINLPEATPEGWHADLLDESVADELIDLQTLGTVPAEKIIQPAQANGTQFETQVDWENAVSEIIPTIEVK